MADASMKNEQQLFFLTVFIYLFQFNQRKRKENLEFNIQFKSNDRQFAYTVQYEWKLEVK